MFFEIFCPHLNKNVYFSIDSVNPLMISFKDCKTNDKILYITIPVPTGRENCAYIDLPNYPWLFDFLSRSYVAKPTYRMLYINWNRYEEFSFDINKIKGIKHTSTTSQSEHVIENPQRISTTNSSLAKKKSEVFHIKAVGVTFGNRQEIISRLKIGQLLVFVPEPTNKYDQYAVKIETLDGYQVGYISKDNNREIFYNIVNKTANYAPFVSSITGGGFKTKYGLNIEVKVSFP